MAARSEALARRAKPLSHVIPSRARSYALADDTVFASSQPVNPFAQLAGARAVGSRRWGSISFSEMERLEQLFQIQLEVTSSSLWLMSGMLAMLKRDSFQPSDQHCSTQPCPLCPQPCLARLELLLRVLVLFGPSVGITFCHIPPSRCPKLRDAPLL